MKCRAICRTSVLSFNFNLSGTLDLDSLFQMMWTPLNKHTSNIWHLLTPLCFRQQFDNKPKSFWFGVYWTRCQKNGWNLIQVLQPCFRSCLPPALWAPGDHRCQGREPSWHRCDSLGRECQLCPGRLLTRWCLSAALQRLHMKFCQQSHLKHHRHFLTDSVIG